MSNYVIILLSILLILSIIFNIINYRKDSYNNQQLISTSLYESNLMSSSPDILTCISRKINKGNNLQSSIAWCLCESLIGKYDGSWKSSPFGKLVLSLPNKLKLSNIAKVKLSTCPHHKTHSPRETCAFTGDQCFCNDGSFPWIGPPCQKPAKNACPRNPKHECSCGGWAEVVALLNDISNIRHIKINSIDNVSIPNLLNSDGLLSIAMTVHVPDLFVEGGIASANARGYLCPSPEVEVGASVKGLGCTVNATVELKIKANIVQNGSYVCLKNSSIDFNIKSYIVYNGVGFVYLDIEGLQVPYGIDYGGAIIDILSATNIFNPWFKSIIESMKGVLLHPINEKLSNIKIPIGNLKTYNDTKHINNQYDNYQIKNNILEFSLNNQLYHRFYDYSMITTNFKHDLGAHIDSLKKYSVAPTKCKPLGDAILTKLINTVVSSVSKLKPSYNLSNVKTKKFNVPSSETDKLGNILSIKRSDSSYAYCIALGLINFNFNFIANLTKLTGINLTKIKIEKNGVCITDDKKVSLILNNEINNVTIGCNIDSGGNLYIPYTTEPITVDAKPIANITFMLQINLNGDFKKDNILVLDQEHCTLTFSNVKISLKSNLIITSKESFFQTIFNDIEKNVNNLFSQILSPAVSQLVLNNLGTILKPEIVNIINNAKIKIPVV